MKESKPPRSKRGSMTINLVETPTGYSIIEGTELLNKLNHSNSSSNNPNSHLASSIQISTLPSQKEQKLTIKGTESPIIETNLLFLRGLYGNSSTVRTLVPPEK